MCDSGDVTEPAPGPGLAGPPPPAAAPAAAEPDPPKPLNLSALLAEALTKSDVCWISTPAWSRLVWHAYDRDVVLVVTGPGEQALPALPEQVELVVRSKDSGGRLLAITARVVVLPPDHEMWPIAAQALAGERLNAVDDQVARWREECTIYLLHPYGVPSQAPGTHTHESGAAAFAPAQVATAGWRPAHLGGRPRRGTR